MALDVNLINFRVDSGHRIWSILQLIQWSSVVRIFWHVEVTVIMAALLWYNYGISSLQNPTYLSLPVILYVVFSKFLTESFRGDH